jgi:DNA-binding NtrC family response regulator
LLDEVGEMPIGTQAKLLRVLEERKLRRLGARNEQDVDVRVLAATNRDPSHVVERGQLRADLYYRLNVFNIHMPALREHIEDLPAMTEAMVNEMNQKHSRKVSGLAASMLDRMMSYDWPGNARELRNAVERALVLGHDEWIEPDDLPDEIVEARPFAAGDGRSYHALVLAAKRKILDATLNEAQGRYGEAARNLGIHVKHLHRLMRSYGLKRD